MDLDRPHTIISAVQASIGGSSSSNPPASANTSEHFISSMKISKSILSPGRAARDGGTASLSSSLSRRLRSNGSIKGGHASPFFTATGKKRGCSFENPEPSSPKVTCIGQVRVKTKKKVKQSRSLSRRRSGEVSFRKMERANRGDGGKTTEDRVSSHQEQQMQQRYSQSHPGASCKQPQECPRHRNQRWVNFPVSICEALRAFGSEFSCLLPCNSSCFSSSEREKSEKQNGSGGNESGCGAVFARWLVSVNDGEGGKSREIELVVGGKDEVEKVSIRSSRRHVFEDIEVKDDRIEEEAARVSICIPPKNALLLMRCRSDPMKVAALMNRFSWDAPRNREDIEEADGEELVVSEEQQQKLRPCEEGRSDDEPTEHEAAVIVEPNEEQEIEDEVEANLEMKLDENTVENQEEELPVSTREEAGELEEEIVLEGGEDEDEVESNMSSFEDLLDQENAEGHHEDCCPVEDMDGLESSSRHSSPSTESDETDIVSNEVEVQPQPVENATAEESTVAEEDAKFRRNDEEEEDQIKQCVTVIEERQEEDPTAIQPPDSEWENPQNQELSYVIDESKHETGMPAALPECLLLMMCEPKLSMEVSKETWVCSTDFIRWLPERPRKTAKATKDGGGGGGGCPHEPVKRRLSIDSKSKPLPRAPFSVKDAQHHHHQQPPRSSCSLPTAAVRAASIATMIEQKLVNGMGYEPLVLTRCKSEPMITAAAKLVPESCFWNNAVRNLDPHSRPTVRIGAAGVGVLSRAACS